MARSRKKSTAQQIVGVATTGLPSPVRKFAGTKLMAGLIVLVVPILFLTGVVSVEWTDGRPHISFNRERAAEVREETAEKIEHFREGETGHARSGLFSPHKEGIGEKVEERFSNLKDRMHIDR